MTSAKEGLLPEEILQRIYSCRYEPDKVLCIIEAWKTDHATSAPKAEHCSCERPRICQNGSQAGHEQLFCNRCGLSIKKAEPPDDEVAEVLADYLTGIRNREYPTELEKAESENLLSALKAKGYRITKGEV